MSSVVLALGRWLTPAFWVGYFVLFVVCMSAAVAAPVVNEGNEYIFAGYNGGAPDLHFKVATPHSEAVCGAYAAAKNAAQAHVRWSAWAGSQGDFTWGAGELGENYTHECAIYRYVVGSPTATAETGYKYVYMVAEPSRDVVANSSIEALQMGLALLGVVIYGVGFIGGQQR